MMVKRRIRPRVGRLAVAGVVLVGLVIGGWLWLRDSSLVSVRRVSVTGVYGADAQQIRAALISSARNMTTLDVRVGQLRTAVAPYPVVKDLRVSTQFPHGMRIEVIEQLPVGALVAGGHAVAAGGNGILLRDVPASSLAAIPVPTLPGGTRVTERSVLNALALLGAAPARLLPKIAQVTTSSPHGLVAQFRDGPALYFGDATDLHAKWVAVIDVLADRGSAGAAYIDVTDPTRPAAGVGASAVTAAGLAPNGGSGTTTAGTSGTSSPSAGTSGASAGTSGGSAGTSGGSAGTSGASTGASGASSGTSSSGTSGTASP